MKFFRIFFTDSRKSNFCCQLNFPSIFMLICYITQIRSNLINITYIRRYFTSISIALIFNIITTKSTFYFSWYVIIFFCFIQKSSVSYYFIINFISFLISLLSLKDCELLKASSNSFSDIFS